MSSTLYFVFRQTRFYVLVIILLIALMPLTASTTEELNSVEARIEYLNQIKKPKFDGPNCYNSALFVAGISPGIYFSTEEIDVWIKSPVCRSIYKEALQKGDIIAFRAGEFTSGHVISVWSDGFALNKNNGSVQEPYEILSMQKILTQFYYPKNIARKCLLTTQEMASRDPECRFNYTSAYRCSAFNEFFSEQIAQNREASLKFIKFGSLLNFYFSEGQTHLLSEIMKLQIELRQTSKNKILMPDFGDLPKSLRLALKNRYQGYSVTQLNILTGAFYLMAHPSSSGSDEIQNLFRKYFSRQLATFSSQHFYYWGNVYLTTNRPIGWEQNSY